VTSCTATIILPKNIHSALQSVCWFHTISEQREYISLYNNSRVVTINDIVFTARYGLTIFMCQFTVSCKEAFQWFKRLFVDRTPREPGFFSKVFHLGYVVDKIELCNRFGLSTSVLPSKFYPQHALYTSSSNVARNRRTNGQSLDTFKIQRSFGSRGVINTEILPFIDLGFLAQICRCQVRRDRRKSERY